MDDMGSLVSHSRAFPLRVVDKERHNSMSNGCWRPRVVSKVLRWFKRSFRPSNYSSYGRWNFKGIGHSGTADVKGESVLLTILSRLRYVFSCIALPSTFISLLEEVCVPFLRSSWLSVVVSSLAVSLIILGGPRTVVSLLKLHPHLLVLPRELHLAGCECLDLQG